MNNMNQIEPGLFMGGAITERPVEIQVIIDLQEEWEDQLSAKDLSGFVWLPILDIPENLPNVGWLDNSVDIVIGWRKLNKNVLIHCAGGVSRSGLLTTAVIMKTHKLTLDTALAFVRQQRPCCSPNHGFIALLLRYQQYLGISNS